MNTRFGTRKILCMLTFATLGAMSASTFAQSMEYRRGYDQGYKDGSAAAQNAPGQPAGARGRILVEQAVYGARGATCDATAAVQEQAGWRRHVEVTASNALCGDPAEGRAKRLDVQFRCGDGPVQRASARESTVLSLYCR